MRLDSDDLLVIGLVLVFVAYVVWVIGIIGDGSALCARGGWV